MWRPTRWVWAAGWCIVTATHQQQHTTTRHLTINGEAIHTTDEHPFLCLTDDGPTWTPAHYLTIGDALIATDGSTGVVEAVRVGDGPRLMVNLTVAHVATYAVGDGAWVVHNVDDVPEATSVDTISRARKISTG